MTIESRMETAREEVITPKKPDNHFNSLVDLNDILVPDLKTRLLLSKPPIHQVEAGLNPLVDAAAYIFKTLGQLIRTRSYDDLSELHTSLINKINDFQVAIQFLQYSKELLSEYVPVSTYILCTTVDDIISGTSFGNQERWLPYRLLTLYDQHTLPQESLLIVLERYTQDPSSYIDMIEFIFICFNLSFKYSSHSSGFTALQLQKIMHALYQHIYSYRGGYHTNLSSSFIHARHAPITRKTWVNNTFDFIKKLTKPKNNVTNKVFDQALMNRFKEFVAAVDSKSIVTKSSTTKLDSLPLTLCIGAAFTGKTSLIEQSRVKFVAHTKPLSIHHFAGKPQSHRSPTHEETDVWNWWASTNSILIDVPGKYFHRKKEKGDQQWEQLIDLFYEEYGRSGLKSVVLFIPYEDLFEKDKRKNFISDFSHRIKQLQDKFSIDLIFHLVVTKCDKIPGFIEYFNQYDQHELSQVFGVSLPTSAITQVILHAFNTRFNQLIKRLNKQLIYHLQQAKDFDVCGKFLIKGFPIEVQSLKEEISEFIKDLLTENLFLLKGVYLTSATQENQKTSGLPQIFSSNEFLQNFNMMETPIIQKQAYFVKQLLLHGLA